MALLRVLAALVCVAAADGLRPLLVGARRFGTQARTSLLMLDTSLLHDAACLIADAGGVDTAVDSINSGLAQAVDGLNSVSGAMTDQVNTGIKTAVDGYNTVQPGLQATIDALDPVVKGAAPMLQKAAPVLTDVAGSVTKASLDFVASPKRPLEVAADVTGGVGKGLLDLGKMSVPVLEGGVKAAAPLVEGSVKAAVPMVEEGVKAAILAAQQGLRAVVDVVQAPDAAAERLRSAVATAPSQVPAVDLSAVRSPTAEEVVALVNSPVAQLAPYALLAVAALVALQRLAAAVSEAVTPWVIPTLWLTGVLLVGDGALALNEAVGSALPALQLPPVAVVAIVALGGGVAALFTFGPAAQGGGGGGETRTDAQAQSTAAAQEPSVAERTGRSKKQS